MRRVAAKYHIIFLGLACLLSSCAYRFTNVAMKPPPGIHTIAVEAVYDVSREVVPSELVWQSMQEEFARNGRLILTSKDQADALVLIRLNESTVRAIGTPEIEQTLLDPILQNTEIQAFDRYKNLKRSSANTVTEQVGLSFSVNVVNLKTREELFSKDYAFSGNFRSIRSTSTAARKTQYLLYEEALQATVKSLSDQLASNVVRDFLL